MLTGILLGLGIGALLGLTGAGGGILAVPALMFGLGLSLPEAAPIALLAVGLAALAGALQGLRQGVVRYRAALLMAALGSLTAPLGIAAARGLPASGLDLLFAAVLLWVAYRMAASSRPAPGASGDEGAGRPCRLSPQTGRLRWTGAAAATLGAIGSLSGLTTGMLGVGGGFIIVPALRRVSDVGMNGIVATSLLVIALVALTTVASTAVMQDFRLSGVAAGFIAAAVAGMLLGRLAAGRVPARVLQRGFAAVCMGVATLMVWQALA